jgi:hypothetical protein
MICTHLPKKWHPFKNQSPSFQVLLRTLLVEKDVDAKLASIGKVLMQGTRPRVLMAPLLLDLGVELHHHFASRFFN